MTTISCNKDGICDVCGEYVGRSGYGYDPRHSLDECVSILAAKIAELQKELSALKKAARAELDK